MPHVPYVSDKFQFTERCMELIPCAMAKVNGRNANPSHPFVSAKDSDFDKNKYLLKRKPWLFSSFIPND